jgi:hypothetical protein
MPDPAVPAGVQLVIGRERLGEPMATLREAIEIAAAVNREVGLELLGQLNLFLGVAAQKDSQVGGDEHSVVAQRQLISETISKRRLEQLRRALAGASMASNLLFNRQQMLASIKLVARFGSTSGGNQFASHADFELLVELALAVNSLVGSYGNAIPHGMAGLRELATQLAPTRELLDYPRLDHAFARNYEMLGPLLDRHRHHDGAHHLERLFVFLTQGLGFDAYRDVIFSLLAYTQSLSTTSIGDFQARCFINPHGPDSVFSGPLLEQFLTNVCLDLSRVPDEVGDIRDERHLLLDTLVFRKYPVWRATPERYLCFDPYFLVEKLSVGFYWAVNRALGSEGPGPEPQVTTVKDPDRKKRTHDFSSLWGLLTEDHVCNVLRYSARYDEVSPAERPVTVIEKPHYLMPQEEAFDVVLLDGTNAVVLQVKRSFLTWPERYSGKAKPFFRAMRHTFGYARGAAAEQLLRNIRHAFGLPRERRLPEVPVASVRCVWPVVVFLDPIVDVGLALSPIARRFERLLNRIIPPAYVSLRPVVFIQLEDLEVISEHIRRGDFSLVDCLRAKLGDDRDHVKSFGDFYWGDFAPERGVKFRRNEAIWARYQDIATESLDRLRTDYRTSSQTPFGVVRLRG